MTGTCPSEDRSLKLNRQDRQSLTAVRDGTVDPVEVDLNLPL
jgi:hypothetical protein